MTNETKNQEFNKNIKQLQSMVKDKLFISLAESVYNLKTDMNSLARSAKEKEAELLLQESKNLAAKSSQQQPPVKETPKVEEIKEAKVEKPVIESINIQTTQESQNQSPKSQQYNQSHQYNQNNQRQNYNNQQNYRNNQNYNQDNRNNNYQNRSYNNQNNQNRPYNPNYQNNNTQGQRQGYNNNYQNRPYNNQNGQNNQNRPYNPNYQNNNNTQRQGYNNNYQNRPFNPNYQNNQNRPYNPNYQNNNAQGQRQGYNNNYQNRPFNPNYKPAQPGQRPPFNKDNKRPAINFAQPVITTSPARNFGNKKKEGEKFEEKRQYNKRDLLRRGMLEEQNIEERMLSRKIRNKKKDNSFNYVEKPQGPSVITTDNITIKLLAEVSGKPVSEIIKKFMILGMMVTINSQIDFATAELALSDMGIELVQKLDKTSEEKLHDIQKNIVSYDETDAIARPPIVTVMGHVDHGKTSLLDYIRKTKVGAGEAGGITQSIGAYKVKVGEKFITFIDTPGHEAFTAMRARGASVTDIAILIVAADDGLMPQTIEAINHIKSAKVPMVVAINKMDKHHADPDRVMQQLAEHNVLPEAWGGDTVICKVSAMTGDGIDKLLETIILMADMQDLKANPTVPAIGTVIEAKLDKGKGSIASIIVRDGSLKVGDTIVAGTAICKVKAMIDENSKSVKIATPSMPVTVLGFSEVPSAGDSFTVVDEKLSKQIVEDRKSKQREALLKGSGGNTLEDLIQKTSEKDLKILNIVLKTDVNGSLEALKSSIMKLVNDEVKINILHSSVGPVSESDLILANASSAMVLAFNVGQDSKVKILADRMGLKILSYKIIYQLLEDLERTIRGMKEPKYEEVHLGRAEVLAVFKLSTSGIVAGSMVREGKIVRGEHARIYRGDEIVAETTIKSLKIVKDDVKEAGKDRECGIKLNYDLIQAGDRIECYTLKRIDD